MSVTRATYKKCVYINCTNNFRKNRDISFFSFPYLQEARAKEWQKNCGNRKIAMMDLIQLKNKAICANHFSSEDIIYNKRKLLRKTAVPIKYCISDSSSISGEETEESDTSVPCWNEDIEQNFEIGDHSKVYQKKRLYFNSDLESDERSSLPQYDACTPQTKSNLDSFNASNVVINMVSPKFEVPESVDLTHLNITSNAGESLSDNGSIQRYKCRTCLATAEQYYTQITNHCALGKTIKEAIILLVPKMFSRLKDNDVVCKDCFGVLKSCIKFITRCLEIEDEFEVNSKIIKDVVGGEQTREQRIVLPKVSEIIEERDYHEKSDGNKNFGTEVAVINYLDEDSIKIEPQTLYDSMLGDPLSPDVLSDYVEENKSNINCPVPSKHKIVEQKSTSCKEIVKEKQFSYSCSERSALKEAYERHLEIHPSYLCDKSLNAHNMFTHNVSNSFICDVCGKGYKEPTALHFHLKTHKSGKNYTCDKCSKMFKRKYLLHIHIKYQHDNIYMVWCKWCRLLCRSKAALKYHTRLIHWFLKSYKCSICEKKFDSREYLLLHTTTHTGQRHCSVESDESGKKKNLRYRRIQTLNGQLLPCKLCGKVISDRKTLKYHLSLHLNRHKCRFCSQSFFGKWQRTEHELIHETKVSLFRCKICHKRYKTIEGLDKHVRLDIHRRQQRYGCGICGQKFYRKLILRQHRWVEHVKKEDEFV